MKGRTNATSESQGSERVIISLQSNQVDDQNLLGAKFNVIIGEDSTEYTWEGNAITVKVLVGTEYSIEFGSIEGYNTPETLTFTAEDKNTRTVNAEYKTVVLTINAIPNYSLSEFTNIPINVAYLDINKQLTWTEALKINVPQNTEITITGGSIELFKEPNPIVKTYTNEISDTINLNYKASKVSFNLTTNHPEDVSSLNIEVSWGSTSETVSVTFGTVLNKYYKFGESYSITFPELNGIQHSALNGTGGELVEVTKEYNWEFLIVNVSGATGYTITVTTDGSTFGTQTIASQLYKIPFNSVINVSASDVKGYNTPANQSFTANQASRTVAMAYTKLANGIYIAYSNGTLELASSGSATNAVGVAVISDKCSFIIDKTNQTSNDQMWSSQSKDLSLTNYSSESAAKTDFNGESNTTIIMNEDTQNVAAAYCRGKSITFGTTKQGYLGSGGEWWTIYENWDTISSALTKIGGAALNSYEWTSLENSSDRAWALNKYNGNLSNAAKTFTYAVIRPLYSM